MTAAPTDRPPASSIVVLNRHGAALATGGAAPNAPTIGSRPSRPRPGRQQRSRPRTDLADTVLDFSYDEPAALLIHGRSTFAEHPWAAIVDLFRSRCGRPTTISALAKEFGAWLQASPELDRGAVLRAWQDSLYGYLIEEWSPDPAEAEPPISPVEPVAADPLAADPAVPATVFDEVIARLQASGDAIGLDGFAPAMRRWLATQTMHRPWITLLVVGYDVDAPSPTLVRMTLSGLIGGRVRVDVEPPRTPGPSLPTLIVGMGDGDAAAGPIERTPPVLLEVDSLLRDVFDTLAPLRHSLADDDEKVLRQALLQIHDRIRQTQSDWQSAWADRAAGLTGTRRDLAEQSPAELAEAARALLGPAVTTFRVATLSRDGGYGEPDDAVGDDGARPRSRGQNLPLPASGRRANWVRIGS